MQSDILVSFTETNIATIIRSLTTNLQTLRQMESETFDLVLIQQNRDIRQYLCTIITKLNTACSMP